jgi:hypothetical protein
MQIDRMDSRPKSRVLIRLALAAILTPFVFAFGPPDSSGTYVSLNGGGGRASYSYSSCGYTTHVRSSMYHGGGSVEHRVKPRGWKDPGSLAPRLVTVGASGSGAWGRTYQYDTRDSGNTGERFNEERERWKIGTGGVRLGLDWRYVGLSGGAFTGFEGGHDVVVLPSFGLRLGNTFYYTLSVLEQPLSPMALGETGFGYKTRDFGMWYGLRAPVADELVPTVKFARIFRAGELGVTLMAGPGDDRIDFGGEVFLRYRLPFQ